MSPFGTVTLLVNALTLALSLGFLLIVLWNDARKELNQFFAVFLMMVVVWNVGSLLGLVASLIEPNSPLIPTAVSVMEMGYTGSSIAAYALTAVLVGVHTRRFRWLAFSGLLPFGVELPSLTTSGYDAKSTIAGRTQSLF